MRQTFRQIYFTLQKENNRYLNESVIKEYLCFVGNFVDFTDFFMHLDDEIDFDYDNERLRQLKEGKPIQQIVGYQYFCGHKFFVDEHVLIPRQETEGLVKIMQERIKDRFKDKDISLLDLCCGSGVIGLSLSRENVNLTLADIAKEALEVSRKNALMFKTKQMSIVESDLFNNIDEKFDVVVCNPPYIEKEENIDEQVYRYEPHQALLAKPATIFYEKILMEIQKHLNSEYIIGFEIEEDMEEKLTPLIQKYLGKSRFSFYRDICDKIRFVIIENR